MRKFLKPAEGDRIVLGPPPLNEPLPEKGAEVEMSPWWYTRLRHGDVVEVPPKGKGGRTNNADSGSGSGDGDKEK